VRAISAIQARLTPLTLFAGGAGQAALSIAPMLTRLSRVPLLAAFALLTTFRRASLHRIQPSLDRRHAAIKVILDYADDLKAERLPIEHQQRPFLIS
jgi:hypothetical protein